ncbi:MAG: hypothetical protein ACFB20_04370 [Opitutales bacterium]
MTSVLLFSLHVLVAAQPEAIQAPVPTASVEAPAETSSAASLPTQFLRVELEPVTYGAASAFLFGGYVLLRRLRNRRSF